MFNFSKFLKYSVFAGIFAIPFVPLVIASNSFFPFITGKNFLFRAIVEIIFAFWLILAYLDSSYRPKKSFILWAVSGFLFILTLSTIFGENPYRSFWSNFERMEGLITHLHLFAYFLVLGSVLRKEKNWFWFFHTSIGVSILMSIYGFLQFVGKVPQHQGARLDATFGNAIYLAMYVVFHLFLILFYFFRTRNVGLRVFYASTFIFELVILYYTATRGAVIGFFGGIILLSFLAAILAKNKKRFIGVGVLILLAIFISVFYVLRNSDFVQKSQVLGKFANISSKVPTAQSRLTIWKMSLEGFREHPVLGWGPDNFNLVFNKYYKPSMVGQEPWFDRAHDIIFDWLISAGILGLLFYLSLSFFAVWSAWKIYEKRSFSLADASIMTSLILAYFFHNIFVFDNIVSYILFFAVLAFVHSRSAGESFEEKLPQKVLNQSGGVLFFSSFVLIALIFLFYFANVPGYLTAKTLIEALKAGNSGDLNLVYEKFDKALAYNSFGTSEAREQLSQMTIQIARAPQVPQDIKDKFFLRAETELKKQLEESPLDARYYLFTGALYTSRRQFDDAVLMLNRASELSPQKQQVYFELGDAYLQKGDLGEAVKALRAAYDLDPNFEQAALNLSIPLILWGREKEAVEILQKSFGSEIIPDQRFVQIYFQIKDFDRASKVMEKLIAKEPDNFNHRVMAASLYITIGERQKSIEELEKAIVLNPDFKEQGELYIKEIKAGKNP